MINFIGVQEGCSFNYLCKESVDTYTIGIEEIENCRF